MKEELEDWWKIEPIATEQLKYIDRFHGTRILYGHLSSCGIDALIKRASENEEKYGHRNYSDLAEYLATFPL